MYQKHERKQTTEKAGEQGGESTPDFTAAGLEIEIVGVDIVTTVFLASTSSTSLTSRVTTGTASGATASGD